MLDIARLNTTEAKASPQAPSGPLLGEQEARGRRDGRIGRPLAVGWARGQQPFDGKPGSVGETDAPAAVEAAIGPFAVSG